MQFSFESITYTILSQRGIRTVSTGTLETTPEIPNAVSSDFGPNLVIPEQVQHEGKFYVVTEIGPYSFDSCFDIKTVYIPSSIEIIRTFGLGRLRNCISITFAPNSRLRTIEGSGFYDSYKITSLIFTSNCLKTIGNSAFAYSKKLEMLVIPSSVRKVGRNSLAGLNEISDLYYCSSFQPDNDVFYCDSDVDQTNSSLRIHVTESYKYNKVGTFNVTDHEVGDYCVSKTTICSFINNTCSKKRDIITNVFMFIILLTTEINEYTNTRK